MAPFFYIIFILSMRIGMLKVYFFFLLESLFENTVSFANVNNMDGNK